jgi:hypothetical protein
MAGVMDTRCHLVDQDPTIGRDEELHGEHADIV